MSLGLQESAAWEASTLCTLYKQLFVGAKPLPQGIRLAGQTAIITGENSGLGFEAGRQLLQLGLSNLILGVRSDHKGAVAVSKLRGEYPHAIIDFCIVDLTDYESIMSFRHECEKLERIDYVVLNAGLMANSLHRIERTGHEQVFQTNYLSTVFMVLILLPILTSKRQHVKSDKPTVLSIVGSDTMYLSRFKPKGSVLGTIDNPPSWEQLPQYADSKLLLMMFIARLATKFEPENVIINVCNPGLTSGTGLTHDDQDRGWLSSVMMNLMLKGMARYLQVGASIYIHALLAVSSESHGSFVSDWEIKPYAPVMYTAEGSEIADALWRETMTELSFAKHLSIESLFS